MDELTARQQCGEPDHRLVRSPAVQTALFVLAVGYTLYFASALLIPIAFAVLLGILFFPVVRVLARWGIPRRCLLSR